MKIGLLAVDSQYPNLALMKLGGYHKTKGDKVEWYNALSCYDKVYVSKIFSFTPSYGYYINAKQVVMGGTGHDIRKTLPPDIDRCFPDYDLYGIRKEAYGFLTRGCPNRCKWCIVPAKEGNIAPYMDIEEVAGNRKYVILMDNNILASDYGLRQIEKIIDLGLRVDFNQGLDARLVTEDVARMLAKVKWLRYIRFGCDTPVQIKEVERAARMIDKYGYNGQYFLYCILMEFRESFYRVNHWKTAGTRFIPYCQPFRDLSNPGQIIPQWQKDLAHWTNRRQLYTSVEFKDFVPRKGFKCGTYFKKTII